MEKKPENEEKIRYAIFDMDGTLVDSIRYWLGLIDEYLVMAGGEPLPREHWYKLEKMEVPAWEDYIRALHLSDATDSITVAALMELLGGHYERDVTLRPGALAMLENLQKDGAQMCLVTATPRKQALICLNRLGLLDRFSFLITGDDENSSKRHPEVFLHVAERFGCDVKDLWLFEDTCSSVRTAAALGVHVVVTEEAWQAHHKDEMFALAERYYTDGFLTRLK